MTAAARAVSNRAIVSPRIPERALAEHPQATQAPAPHTAEEISALVRMLRASGATTIAIGHGRHSASREAASALSDAWCGIGRTVLETVDWPAQAASWFKPARRLVRAQPDAWVIIDNPAGCAQLAMRLTECDDWSATRTFGTASLDSPATVALTAVGVLSGMQGATATGGTWRVGNSVLFRDQAAVAR